MPPTKIHSITSNLLTPTNSASDSAAATATDNKPGATSHPPTTTTTTHDQATAAPLSKNKRKPLYDGLSCEDKAKIAVIYFSQNNPNAHMYELKSILGYGSNGVVIGAVDEYGFDVAVKIIYKTYAGVSLTNAREIEALKYLAGQTGSDAGCDGVLLKFVADFQDDLHYYLVTEKFGFAWMDAAGSLQKLSFVDAKGQRCSIPFSSGCSDMWGWAYFHRLHVHRSSGTTLLPLNPVKRIIRHVAIGLQFIHKHGFYHGDLKLENILVADSNTPATHFIKIADFGRCRPVHHGIQTYGTFEVSAPELLHDSPFDPNTLDGRACDVFALGMMLYCLLSARGELPPACRLLKSRSIGYEFLMDRYAQTGFPVGDVDGLDAEGVALLEGMLRVDVARRFTVEEVLAHAYLNC
ncbi:kinase-like domain-containing protein [Chytriomyces cf. hyalinus JEL632]|nr:kinase-like domain-containing protein [Chytriomyces cf. hyalinus JEL632]